jgi:hypothetical protein
MKQIKGIISLIAMMVLIILGSIGCRTLEGMKSEPLNEGEERIFNADYNQVLKAAQESIPVVGLQIEETKEINGSTWMILAKESGSTGVFVSSYGTLVRVVIEKMDSNRTVVRVISKRKLATNIGATGDFSQQIFSTMNVKLAGK